MADGAQLPCPAMTATLLDVTAGVATITLNRPDNRNALSEELVASLGDHLEVALADPAVRAVVLTNVGNTFCAGADLRAAVSGEEPKTPRRDFTQIFDMIIDSPKPVIGRIAGHALAGGLGLAASCDISVMAASATLGFTEVRIGVAPAVISVVVLPKLRKADAAELFLCGERISAARGAEVGLVNYAVPDDELDAKVAEIVGKVVRGGPREQGTDRQGAHHGEPAGGVRLGGAAVGRALPLARGPGGHHRVPGEAGRLVGAPAVVLRS
jgi:methylglutaconyl-CoA hydratase